MSGRMPYKEIVQLRRDLRVPKGREREYGTLASACLNGPWVTPRQITPRRPDRLALDGWHFLDWDTARAEHRRIREDSGYYEGSPFCRRLVRALDAVGLSLEAVYLSLGIGL